MVDMQLDQTKAIYKKKAIIIIEIIITIIIY